MVSAGEAAGAPGPVAGAPEDALRPGEAGGAAIRGGGYRVAGYAAGVLLALVSTPLLVRHLGVVDYGRYATVVSLLTVVGALAEGGIVWIAVRELATAAGARRDELIRNLLALRVALTALATAVAVAFAAASYDRTMLAGTVLAGGGFFLQSLQQLIAVPAQVRLRYGLLTVIDLCTQTASVCGVILLVVLGAGLLPFWAVSIVSFGVGLTITVAKAREGAPLRPSLDRALAGRLLRESLPFGATIAVGSVYFRITLIVVGLVASRLETGYFALSYRVFEVLVMVPVLLVGAVFPLMARAAHDDRRRLSYIVGRTLEVSLVVGALTVVGVVVGAPFALQVIAGDAGHGAISVLRIQGVALLATFVAQSAGFALLSVARYRVLLASTLSAFALNVLLAATLGGALGARGGAIANVTTEVLLAALFMVALHRYGGGLRLPVRTTAVALGAGGVAMLALLVPAPSAAQLAIAVVLYAAVILGLRAVPGEVAEAVAGLRRRRAAP